MVNSSRGGEYDGNADIVNNELSKPGVLEKGWGANSYGSQARTAYPEDHVKACRNIAGYFGVSQHVEWIATSREWK